MAGFSTARSRYDTVGASGGPDIGNVNPDSAAFLIRSLSSHLDRVNDALLTKNKDAPAEQIEFEVDNSNIPSGGMWLKLPTGIGVASYYIENNSTATLSVYAGQSSAGRVLNIVNPTSFKVALAPQQVTSIVVTTSSTAIVGTVRLLLTSIVLGPSMGSTIGAAAAPATSTAVVTVVSLAAGWTTLLPPNPARIGALIYTNSATVPLLGLGNTTNPSMTAGSFANTSLPVNWKGSITAYLPSGTSQVYVTEFS